MSHLDLPSCHTEGFKPSLQKHLLVSCSHRSHSRKWEPQENKEFSCEPFTHQLTQYLKNDSMPTEPGFCQNKFPIPQRSQHEEVILHSHVPICFFWLLFFISFYTFGFYSAFEETCTFQAKKGDKLFSDNQGQMEYLIST